MAETKVINVLEDIVPLTAEECMEEWGQFYVNKETGGNWLDNPTIMNYICHFPAVSLRKKVGTKQLVPVGTVPEMTLLCDGTDERKGQMASAVKEAGLEPVFTQGNLRFYEIVDLYDVISKVGRRGDTTGYEAIRKAELEVFFASLNADLAMIADIIGSSAAEFSTLFDADGTPSFVASYEAVLASANAKIAALKEEKKANKVD